MDDRSEPRIGLARWGLLLAAGVCVLELGWRVRTVFFAGLAPVVVLAGSLAVTALGAQAPSVRASMVPVWLGSLTMLAVVVLESPLWVGLVARVTLAGLLFVGVAVARGLEEMNPGLPSSRSRRGAAEPGTARDLNRSVDTAP